jgi:acetyl-CoA synthetase
MSTLFDPSTDRRGPHPVEHESTSRTFRGEQAEFDVAGLPGGQGLNIAHEALGRHVAARHGCHTALRVIGGDDTCRDVSYAELHEAANRVANVLAASGVLAGDVVTVLLPPSVELYAVVLGALAHRCVVSSLPVALGPDLITSRLRLASSSLLVTTDERFDEGLAVALARMADQVTVLVTGTSTARAGTVPLEPLLATADPDYEIEPTDPEDPAFVNFTGGATGDPKCVLHVHGSVAVHAATAAMVLDLHVDDIYWSTADPGWSAGMPYGIVAPLVRGVTSVVDTRPGDADRCYDVLADQEVDVWFTSPAALRRLMRTDAHPEERRRPLPFLRLIASTGGVLGADVAQWALDEFGVPVHDTWSQAEAGGIMIANVMTMPIRSGSIGKPVPGVTAAVVGCDAEGTPVRRADRQLQLLDGRAQGMLALRATWPSMFRGYVNDPDRYAGCFAPADGAIWYLTGDLVRRDDDGYFRFVARADDVMSINGHLIGPFEVESVLAEHPAVAQVAVYSVPDPVAGSVAHAAVVVRDGVDDSDDLRWSLLQHARRHLGVELAPTEVTVVGQLPITRSGKVLRRLLRARETSRRPGPPDSNGGVSGLQPAAVDRVGGVPQPTAAP